MFDVGDVSTDHNTANEPAESTRRQYTLKGVEADTIRLMRDAASVEGMKIGSWVSLRMKEAAERALSDAKAPDNGPVGAADQMSKNVVESVMLAILSLKQDSDARFLKLERELYEIANGQRAILTNLLNSK